MDAFGFDDSIHTNLDSVLDQAAANSEDLFSIAGLVHGHETRPNKMAKTKDVRPVTLVTLNSRKGKPKPVTLTALLDSGGSGCLINAKHVKHLRVRRSQAAEVTWSTPAGNMTTNQTCIAHLRLDEIVPDAVVEWKFHVTEQLGNYDMIIGRDMLQDLGIDLCFSDNTIRCSGNELPFKPVMDGKLDANLVHIEEPPVVQEALDRRIAENDYAKADLPSYVSELKYLSPEEKQSLLALLRDYESLFDGTLGEWKGKPYHIQLREGATPYHAKAFPIPRINMETMRREVERLVKIGVLRKVNRSEWAAPTYLIKKKTVNADGVAKARFISDFRQLNARIKRTPYPIPKIQDMLQQLEGFTYASSIDLNMGYYHIKLDAASSKLCTIVLPWGKYEYTSLPMGLSNSPDVFQEKMNELFHGFEYVRAYIDDLLVISKGTYEDHLTKLREVFTKLREAGLKVNAEKSFFCTGETEYLGYWITRDGVQPMPKKVHAIMKIAEPTNKKQLRGFIGLVNYYRDMWIRRSHILAPLARLTSKTVKWEWGERERKAFNNMKKVICREVMLAFPNFSKPFVIHTDASHTQLGAVISQDEKPIAFYSRKLNSAQTRYTTTERELLSIVETLKEFRNILLGYPIVVYTDHKNLTCAHFNTERVMRWRLILEEYGPELRYIKGEKNIVADALSRLDLDDSIPMPEVGDEISMAEAFAHDSAIEFPTGTWPLHLTTIQKNQQEDAKLQALVKNNPLYAVKKFVWHTRELNLVVWKDTDRIVLPESMQKRAIQWYHDYLLHPGSTRTERTMGQHFYWKGMKPQIEQHIKRCKICQIEKNKSGRNTKKGHLPAKGSPEAQPWKTLCIDLIGPYDMGPDLTQSVKNDDTGKWETKIIKHAPKLHCLTMIDPATGWFEIVQVDCKEPAEIGNELEIAWLCRYPHPDNYICDRGREFMGECMRMLKEDYNIHRSSITTRNPQANAILERVHKTVHAMIRARELHKVDIDERQEKFVGVLCAITRAVNSTVHTTTNATPSQLVFGRDAFFPIGFQADWNYIAERKQHLIVKNNERENAKRVPHQYTVGDLVLLTKTNSRKHGGSQALGPFGITQVYDNGTVRIRRQTPSGNAKYETWNIRQLRPYYSD